MEAILENKEARVIYHFITDIFDGDVSQFSYYCREAGLQMDNVLSKLELVI
jgi:hypothetical protein